MSEDKYYSVKFSAGAEKSFKKIPKTYQILLCKELLSLSKEKFPRRWMHRIVGQRDRYSYEQGTIGQL